MHNNNENKTGREMAAEYADGIVEDLTTLAALVDNWDTVSDVAEMLARWEDLDADEISEFEELRDDAEVACGGVAEAGAVLKLYRELGGDDAGEAVAAWLDGVLDIEMRGIYRDGEWEVEEVAALVTFGGPSARVVWDGSGTLAVRVSWWSEEVVRRVECDALVAAFEEIAEGVNA